MQYWVYKCLVIYNVKNFKVLNVLTFYFFNYILIYNLLDYKQKFLRYMRLLILFDVGSKTVIGFFYLGKTAGAPYAKDGNIFIRDPRFSGLMELKTPSRFERLKHRYESGMIIIDVPVSDFTYSCVNTSGPRDLIIEKEWKKLFQ